MDKLKVLVIDDSPQIREFVIEYILKPNGYDIDVATDGAMGLQKVLTTQRLNGISAILAYLKRLASQAIQK